MTLYKTDITAIFKPKLNGLDNVVFGHKSRKTSAQILACFVLERCDTYVYFLFLGPGQYDLKFPQEHRSNLMTTKDRRLKYKNEETPGPGTYEVSTSLSFLQVLLSFCKFTLWNFHYCVMFVLQHFFMTA